MLSSHTDSGVSNWPQSHFCMNAVMTYCRGSLFVATLFWCWVPWGFWDLRSVIVLMGMGCRRWAGECSSYRRLSSALQREGSNHHATSCCVHHQIEPLHVTRSHQGMQLWVCHSACTPLCRGTVAATMKLGIGDWTKYDNLIVWGSIRTLQQKTQLVRT